MFRQLIPAEPKRARHWQQKEVELEAAVKKWLAKNNADIQREQYKLHELQAERGRAKAGYAHKKEKYQTKIAELMAKRLDASKYKEKERALEADVSQWAVENKSDIRAQKRKIKELQEERRRVEERHEHKKQKYQGELAKLASPGESKDSGVLLPPGEMWWRFAGNLPSKLNDRIASGRTKPTRRPDTDIHGVTIKVPGTADWAQWDSAAITFAGVAESDSSGLATETARRNPLSYGDCQKLTAKLSTEYPGTVLVDIPIPATEDMIRWTRGPNKGQPKKDAAGRIQYKRFEARSACVVYIPGFFRNHQEMAAEMRRLRPEYIDRHSQRRDFALTHKNKRWNTNVTDKTAAREARVYEDFHLGVQQNQGPLASSEVPFSRLSAFQAARDQITRLGEAVLPDETREPFGSQKYNLSNLCCELNFYFGDGGIGYHGDAERNLVFGGSIGTGNRIIEWCRFKDSRPYTDSVTQKWEVTRLTLKPGDAYVMSEYAAGVTWKSEKSRITVRHRAGTEKFLYSQPVSFKQDGKSVSYRTHTEDGADASNFHSTDYSES